MAIPSFFCYSFSIIKDCCLLLFIQKFCQKPASIYFLCRPEYISIASGLATIGIQKNDRFAKVDYMSEEAVKTLLVEPDTRTEIGVRDQFLIIFLYDTGCVSRKFWM